MRVAIYARAPVRNSAESVSDQIMGLRDFADSQPGWTVVRTFIDEKQFPDLLIAAADRLFDIVLFTSLDRFCRDGVPETLHHLHKLTSIGIAWRSTTEPVINSAKDDVLGIMAAIAQQERIRIKERTLEGQARSRAKGVKTGRPPVAVDMERLERLIRARKPIREIAKKMKISPGTVQNRVQEILDRNRVKMQVLEP